MTALLPEPGLQVGEEGLEARGPLAVAGRMALLVLLPASLIWLPLGAIPGLGNVTVGDGVLFLLWALVLLGVVGGGLSRLEVRPVIVIGSALLIGALAALGSELSLRAGRSLFELSLALKRFGLAAVVPVATSLFRGRRAGPAARWMTFLTLVLLAAFALSPDLQASLPRPPSFDPDVDDADARATGLLNNPNDLAYAAVGLMLLHGAFFPRRPGRLDGWLLAGALACSGAALVKAESRSGVMGAALALAWILASRRLPTRARAFLLLGFAGVLVAGLFTSTTFEERLSRAYRQGRSEESVNSRLEAQWIAVQGAIRYPLGVGFTGFAKATRNIGSALAEQGADSVYCDTLLGSGFAGLALLLVIFGTGWRHVSSSPESSGLRPRVLQASLLAFAMFGTASIAPFTVAIAPVFFSLVGAASYPEEEPDGAA